MSSIHVELDEVFFHYGRTTVLHGLTWSLAGPAVIGLLGPNGTGKTTLIRLLATILEPAAGTIRFNGSDTSKLPGREALRLRLGYLPQELGYHPSFTALEFVAYVGWLRGMTSRNSQTEAQSALEVLGMADRANTKMRKLSGGQLRRVGIAQALVNRPAVLLLDEPTAGLDPGQRLDFRRLLRQVGKTSLVLVSTHLVEDVAAACDSVGVVREGSVVFQGSPMELEALGRDNVAEGGSAMESGYLAALSIV